MSLTLFLPLPLSLPLSHFNTAVDAEPWAAAAGLGAGAAHGACPYLSLILISNFYVQRRNASVLFTLTLAAKKDFVLILTHEHHPNSRCMLPS